MEIAKNAILGLAMAVLGFAAFAAVAPLTAFWKLIVIVAVAVVCTAAAIVLFCTGAGGR